MIEADNEGRLLSFNSYTAEYLINQGVRFGKPSPDERDIMETLKITSWYFPQSKVVLLRDGEDPNAKLHGLITAWLWHVELGPNWTNGLGNAIRQLIFNESRPQYTGLKESAREALLKYDEVNGFSSEVKIKAAFREMALRNPSTDLSWFPDYMRNYYKPVFDDLAGRSFGADCGPGYIYVDPLQMCVPTGDLVTVWQPPEQIRASENNYKSPLPESVYPGGPPMIPSDENSDPRTVIGPRNAWGQICQEPPCAPMPPLYATATMVTDTIKPRPGFSLIGPEPVGPNGQICQNPPCPPTEYNYAQVPTVKVTSLSSNGPAQTAVVAPTGGSGGNGGSNVGGTGDGGTGGGGTGGGGTGGSGTGGTGSQSLGTLPIIGAILVGAAIAFLAGNNRD